MLSWQTGRNVLNILKRKRPGDPELSGLLGIPPEIELSNSRKVPYPDSVTPSWLLNAESRKVESISDLDLFFERLYNYYCEKGLWCVIVKWIVELLSLAFTICFAGFFLLYVDWIGLRNAKCGIDAVKSGFEPCDLSKEALHDHPLSPLTLYKAIILGTLGVFSVYWVFCFLRFFAQLKGTLKIRHFYYNCLHVTDNELKTMPWSLVLEKVVRVQNSHKLCVVKDLSAHDIVMRLMRKENYLIGMINKGILAFPISTMIPGAGPIVKSGVTRGCQRLVLPNTLEWTLNWCILHSMFDRNYCVRKDFLSNPDTLRNRLVLIGLGMIPLSPFLTMFLAVFHFLRHAELLYHHPATASVRRWSNLSKWMFREFNEVEHFFRHRINSSVMHASDYLKQFPSPIILMVLKFITFIFGGFAAVLIIIALLDESLVEGHIFGRNLIWYGAVFGAITAISRAAVTDEVLVHDPELAMSLVVQHTHYMPKRWRGKENTENVQMEFETLFQYTAMTWLEEMASIFVTPYLLIFVVPKRVIDILEFIAENTVFIDGVGDVCSFSAFDFRKHGNGNYASPYNSLPAHRSSQGKMEKSFLSFQTSYPFWQPDSQGTQFLTTLGTFWNEKLRDGSISGYTYSPSRHWSTRNRYFRRESPYNCPVRWYHLGSLWLIETDPKTYPYLLDWFYVSGSRLVLGDTTNASTVVVDIDDNEENKELRIPSLPSKTNHEESRVDLCEDRSRSNVQEFASPIGLLGDQSVLRHPESSTTLPPMRSRWWDRSGPSRTDPQQASFFEPPNFVDQGRIQQGSLLKLNDFSDQGRQQGSFLEPPDFSDQGRLQQGSFLEPPDFSDQGRLQQGSFLEPPDLSDQRMIQQGSLLELPDFGDQGRLQQGSFLEPPDFSDQGRLQQGNFLEPPDSIDQGRQQQASFLEPIELNYQNANVHYERSSERSVDERDQLNWKNYDQLSRTTYSENCATSLGELKLHFSDVYDLSEPSNLNPDPRT